MISRRVFGVSMLAASVAGRARSATTPLRLVLLGQALLQNNLDRRQWPAADRFAALLSGADVVFSDMETAIKGPQAEAATRKGEFLHAAGPEILDCLKRARLNMLATSNNHAFDFGAAGIADAIASLDERGFTHAGTGVDLAQAAAPAYRRTAHGTVALVAMASGAVAEGAAATAAHPGVNEVRRDASGALNADDVARVIASIAQARAKADLVIAYQHNHYWEKNMAEVSVWQPAFARGCLDAGADVFVAHGAPLLQPVEVYKGKLIFYDLGGLFFQTVTAPGYYPPEVWQSVVVECRWDKKAFAQVELIPVQLNDTGLGGAADMITRGTPALATGDNADRILKRLADISAPYGTKFRIAGGKARLVM